MTSLLITSLQDGLKLLLSAGQNTVGRHESMDIVIQHNNVSRKHACLYLDADDRLSVMDLGSTFGTRINDTCVGSTWVTATPGDTLVFGGLAYEVRSDLAYAKEIRARRKLGEQQARAAEQYARTRQRERERAEGQLILDRYARSYEQRRRARSAQSTNSQSSSPPSASLTSYTPPCPMCGATLKLENRAGLLSMGCEGFGSVLSSEVASAIPSLLMSTFAKAAGRALSSEIARHMDNPFYVCPNAGCCWSVSVNAAVRAAKG